MSKQETAAQLRKVANFLKGLTQAADDIEAIGSMEGATKEAQEARDLALAERDRAMAELADAKAKGKAATKAAEVKVADMLAKAQADADALLVDARAKAEADAEKTARDAKQHENEVVADAEAHASRVKINADALVEKVKSLTAEVSDMETKRAVAQADLDRLTKALDKIKAQFKIEA